ncbi:hypothetical protein [Arthrobacter cavernae]|uniref:DoxX family protein n=1 Tax=Arthrobacter cavernae TaxID=2817681 RepID=A0A939HDL3_9MICC|nr:hypothetical protein [Arthrobacter cavernae]MBO1266410.1 hypothetical protein [Arthrobacter cavernae]
MQNKQTKGVIIDNNNPFISFCCYRNYMPPKKINYAHIDLEIVSLLKRAFIPAARVSIFVTFFWFGSVKLTGASPAGPLAEALTAKTIGLQHFDASFITLSVVECVIGVLFLFPKMTRIVIPLLLAHMVLVSSPLALLPDHTWQQPFVPTLEGQYILKNVVVVAVAIGIAASVQPLDSGHALERSPRRSGVFVA